MGRSVLSRDVLDPKTSVKLDYVLSHVEGDERAYLTVQVLGCEIKGLLDSGANRTVVNSVGLSWLNNLGLVSKNGKVTKCTLADGSECCVPGVVTVPFSVRDHHCVLDVIVVPNVKHTLILGVDFWKSLGIVPDLRRGEWSFSSDIVANVCGLSSVELPESQRIALESVVQFGVGDGKSLGCTHLVKHVIRTNSEPIKQRYYPLSPVLRGYVNEELDKMLELGVVRPSNSPWSSPIVMVKKKDGSYRFCVDYRKVNAVTQKDAYPLPYISNILDMLRDANYLSTIDIKSAYWQIPMDEESKPITAFTVPNRGLFEFNRLPFGLHNAPATWQRLIDRVIGADLNDSVFVYLDDIVIATSTFDEHLRVLKEVIQRLQNAGLTINKEKCQLGRKELKYLGYVVDNLGLRVDPDKVSAILAIPAPSNIKEVRRIVGMASWYRRFIPNFSTLVAPIVNLLRKGRTFKWSSECEKAFLDLKHKLVTAPVLRCPDFNVPFRIHCDASDFGLGGVLSQETEEGEQVVAYASRSLMKNERNFTTTEKECLAILYSIEKFRPYIEGSHFTVVTDHYALKWLNNLKDPNGRLARWCVKLQQYDFDVVHRPGKDHVLPDALSRAVPVIGEIEVESVKDKWYNDMLSRVSLKPQKYPLWTVEGKKLLRRVNNLYPGLTGGKFSWRTVVPKEERKSLICKFHDEPTSGHMGTYKTYHRLAEKFYWPKMRNDVASYIRRCQACLMSKPDRRAPAGKLLGRPDVVRPWQTICVDLVGPLPKSLHGNMYVLSCLDYFSKFVLLFPLRTANAKSICRQIEDNVFCLFGVPAIIICDNGKQFVSKEFKDLAQRYNVKLSFTPFYHPQANAVERVHSSINNMLRAYVGDNQRAWDDLLPKIACAIRTSRHEATKLSPYFINFGREAILDGQTHSSLENGESVVDLESRAIAFKKVYNDVRKRLDQAFQKNKSRYDLRRRDKQFVVGQRVFRRNFPLSKGGQYFMAKLAPRFLGPFIVSKRCSPWTYEIRDMDGRFRGMWHAKDLRDELLD